MEHCNLLLLKHCNRLLQSLKSQCQANPDFLWNTNLGDWIEEHGFDQDVHRDEGSVMLLHQGKTAVRSFMLHHLKLRKPTQTELGIKLTERDSHGWPLLHRAIEENLVEVVAQLLTNGADPGIKTRPAINKYFNRGELQPCDILPLPGISSSSLHSRPIQDLLHIFAGQSPTEYVEVAHEPSKHVSWKSSGIARSVSVKELQKLDTAWVSLLRDKETSSHTWIHVPSTNVCIFPVRAMKI